MKRWICLLLVLCTLFGTVGCSYFAEQNPGEGATIHYHLPEIVTSIDPQTVQSASARTVVHALYEGLCRVNAQNELLPGVAERWEPNADNSVFTFYLREDARWNNDDPVTAADFAFAFARALEPNTGSADVQQLFCIKNARAVYAGAQSASALGVTVVNDHTLRIELETPDGDFPYKTAQAVYMPCNRAFFEETKGRYGLTYRTSCTNGPFGFINRYSWEERKSISLSASTRYVGETPVLPAYVELTMGSNGAYEDAVAALQEGTVDLCGISPAEVQAALDAGCTVTTIGDTTHGILLNPADDVLAVEEIRRMMFAALDADVLAGLVGENTTVNIVPAAAQLGGSIYRAQTGDCTLPQHKDVTPEELAAVLGANQLESVGSMTILCTDDPAVKAVANEMLITWNNAFGTYFNILPLPEEELQARVARGEYQICIVGVQAERLNPYGFMGQLLALCPEETMIEDLQNADTPAQLHGVEQQLVDRGLVYPLWSSESCFAQAPAVSGAFVHPLSALDFTAMLKTKK